MHTPTLSLPSQVTDTASRLGKAAAERMPAMPALPTTKAKKKRRRTRMLLTRGPLLAGLGMLVKWLADPVHGPERRQMIKSKAQGLVGRGQSAPEQVRGEAESTFERMGTPAQAVVPPQPGQLS